MLSKRERVVSHLDRNRSKKSAAEIQTPTLGEREDSKKKKTGLLSESSRSVRKAIKGNQRFIFRVIEDPVNHFIER